MKVVQTELQWYKVALPDEMNSEARRVVIALARELQNDSTDERSREDLEGIRARALNETLGNSANEASARLICSVLCDLAIQGWKVRQGKARTIDLCKPIANHEDPIAEKRRVQLGHAMERDRQLTEEPVRRFVREMEESRIHKGKWVSIFSLMRDGRELAAALAHSTGADVIDPYIQLADGDSVCEHTGLRLIDIWRYFRYTWSTAYQSTPGRRMLMLVRDRAAPFHPVIGIAALGSSIVQMTVRDEWIGWTPSRALDEIAANPSIASARWLLDAVDQEIESLYVKDLIADELVSRAEIRRPNEDAVARLLRESERARRSHERYPRQTEYKTSMDPTSVDWEAQAKSFLFRSKRAAALAAAMKVRMRFLAAGLAKPNREGLLLLLGSSDGRKAIASALRFIKARHVGVDMLDITVCGAVAPYNHLIGGKLVSLLMMSTEVVEMYHKRYASAVSVIASSMSGCLVQRKPRLVLLGTTSLYGTTSSQYNRLRIPKEALGSNGTSDLKFELLGRTEGFGSYQFSESTMREIEVIASQRRSGRRVNSIFGEGVNPKMRKVRESLSAVGFSADALLNHGSPRLVYGVPLAENFREVLTDRAARPKYLLRGLTGSAATQLISNYWRSRWLIGRTSRDGVMDAVAGHTLVRPVSHGARVRLAPEASDLPLFADDV